MSEELRAQNSGSDSESEAKRPTTPPEATVAATPTPSAAAPRVSRQTLVQPPASTSAGSTLILGSMACAALGFAMVWFLGIGRSGVRPPVGDEPMPEPPVAVFEPAPETPEAGPERIAAQPAPTVQLPSDTSDGSTSGTPDAEPVTAPTPPRFLVPPNAADLAAAQPEPAAETGGTSRFTAQPVALQDAPAEAPSPEEPAATEPTEPSSHFSSFNDEPPEVPATTLRSPPLEATLAAAAVQPQPPSAVPVKRPPTPEPFDDPEAPVPVTPPGGGPVEPPNSPPQDRPHDRLAASDTTRGFGIAPPPAASAQSWGGSPAPAPASPLPAADGGAVRDAVADGRPGPIQLEGVQTPQVAIEKRGPREVQVGKAARYDMIVRNVGSAAAHDVMLRDRVPQGTRLLSTSPPAAPGDDGQLVWAIGSLPQGGQARVAMEVMPTEEGEVGSVASVSFRADASVRSVATRAALAIDVAEPKPVLVGADLELAITISNPGTGDATGVVLEGALPQGFRHAAGSELEFDVGRLRPGDTRRVDLKLVSTHPGVQSLRMIARADGEIESERIVRLEVTAPTLELAARMPARRYLQRPAACVIDMANTGTAPANTVELAVQLPPGMKFIRANNAGYYEESTHRVLWHLEKLPAAEVGNVEMVLMPTELGPQRIAAAARSADGLSAQIAHTVEVEGLAAILFEVGDSEDPIEVDGVTEYVVRVGNQGTKPATGVRVVVSLLGDLEPLEAKGPVRHRIENLTVVYDPLAKLAPAEESVFRIRVRGRRAGDQRVQVQVTSDDNPTPITKEEVTRVYEDR